MPSLSGKVALVTGGGSGNGRAIAARLAHEGAAVLVTDVTPAGMAETLALIGEGAASSQWCDVTSKAAVEEAVAVAVREFGRLDIVVANAGVIEGGADCFELSEDAWDRTIGINLKGAFLTFQAGARQMRAQGGGGRLIALSSITATWGAAGAPAYAASKGGIEQLVKSFAVSGGPHRITANAVAPGFIRTPMSANQSTAFADYLIDRTPLGALGEPEDVAAVVAFLAGDEARFITGASVLTDGGITAGIFRGDVLRAAAAPD